MISGTKTGTRQKWLVYFPILIFFMANPYSGFSQHKDIEKARSEIYQGYISNNPNLWNTGIDILKRGYTQTKNDVYRYELALAYYGKIGFLLSLKEETAAEKLTDRTIALLEDLVTSHPQWAEVHAILGSVYALKIGMSPSKTLVLGPKSSKHIEKAIDLDPKSPQAWLEMGNFRFHSPRLFGGSKQEALEAFSQSAKLFESLGKTRSWEYLHAMAWLGKTYEEMGKPETALTVYQKLLQHEPSFLWAKEELLPQLEQKMNR